MGSILPPSDRERRLGRRSRSFCVSEPLKLSATIPPMTATRPSHSRRRAFLALTAALVLVVAACQSAAPSVSPSPSASQTPAPTASPSAGGSVAPSAPASPADLSATYASIEDQVRTIRGLEAKKPVDPVVLDDAGIKKVTADGFRKDNPQALVDANERLLKGLGLLPQDANLGDLYVEAPRRAGRRPVQPRRQAALRRVALRQAGPDREDDVRPRVHPRAAGPELRPRVAEARRGGRGRQGDRGPVARRRRRDARHVALADPAPQPGGAAASSSASRSTPRSRAVSTRCRRSSASRCCSRTRPA